MIHPDKIEYAYGLLKTTYRRMNQKATRHTQTLNSIRKKGVGGTTVAVLFSRIDTWSNAAVMVYELAQSLKKDYKYQTGVDLDVKRREEKKQAARK